MIAAKPSQALEVLLADDDPVSRELLEFHLERLGCRVQSVDCGNGALRALRDGENRISFVVIDAYMPGPSPCRLFEEIRAIKPSVPVLFCSGMSSDARELRLSDAYRVGFLPKPFSHSELVDALGGLQVGVETPVGGG